MKYQQGDNFANANGQKKLRPDEAIFVKRNPRQRYLPV